MKGRLTLQQRLVLPIILLGLVMLLANILAVFSINNVHANAGTIVDQYMVSEERLEELRRSMMDIHRLALSHIVAEDHATMIKLVQEIKEEEAALDGKMRLYEGFVAEDDQAAYRSLLENYDAFKRALVDLVCASADSKTQAAYATANGEVALRSQAAEGELDALSDSVSSAAAAARSRLLTVYAVSLATSAAALVIGVLLMMAALRNIRRSVISPIRHAVDTLQDSSERLSGVVGEVRRRVSDSSSSVRRLSGLTDRLSAAFGEISDSTAVISASAANMQDSAQNMAEECAAITCYSTEMRERAEGMERSAKGEMEAVRVRTAEIVAMLDKALEQSKSVNQIAILTKDILSISSSTDLIAINASIEASRAGESGKGFAVVAQEIRQLADSCTETANHIQEVSTVVTGAVGYLAKSAQELADYLGEAVAAQLELSVRTGQQYREDSDYIKQAMESFSDRTNQFRSAMDEIAGSISSISSSVEGAVSGITGAAGSTRSLVNDMAGIAGRMDANQEIVGKLQSQMQTLANL